MILIGSRAIKNYFPEFPREPKDIDYAVDKPHSNVMKGVEYLYNPVFVSYCKSIGVEEASMDSLLTLKASHLFWDINWDKHCFDVQWLLKKGCKINLELFYDLYNYWNEYHSKNKRSDLKMSANDFFNNALNTGYDHDYIHTLLNPTPTYTKVLIGEVEVGEDKFNQLSFEEKCDLVYEEVMVMAWERYSNLPYLHAYTRMLKKFILSHAPLWEALFIIENYIKLHKPPYNYYERINRGLKYSRNQSNIK